MKLYTNKSVKGFTIVEIIVVVVVIGIVASLGMVGWGSWQQNVAKKQVESDMNQLASAMESAKNFSNAYPTSLPTNFKASAGVTVTYIAGSSTAFCVEAQSVKFSSVVYHVDSLDKKPMSGACGGSFALTAPSPSISSVSSSAMTVTWGAVSGATSYTVKYGTGSPTVTASCSSSPCSLSGLTSSTNYKVNVTATNSTTSATSSTINATTTSAIPPPSGNIAVTLTWQTFKGTNTKTGTATASGGSCSVGSLQWELAITFGDPESSWSAWQVSNIKTVSIPANGIIPPSDFVAYAKPRCISGSEATEYDGYAASNTF